MAGLSSYHLHELVQQLLHLAPTLQELKTHLTSVIHSLNKPAEYTLIANTIVRHLRRLYPDAITHSSEHYQSLYGLAANQLGQDDEHIRIKKLLYFVCRDQWTQDLDNVNLSDLVGEMHILTPTQSDLKAVLESVIQNVSKPEKYRAIAQRIIRGLAPLYAPATQAVMASPSSPEILSRSTPLIPNSPISPQSLQGRQLQEISVPTATGEDVLPTPLSAITYPKSPSPTPPAQRSHKSVSMRKKVASLSMDDLFSLRIEIHKFTNPLLAKYVLFMNSYATAIGSDHNSEPGQWDSMTWDALRSTDLDTLLRDGLKSCRNIREFERSLKRTTRQLSASQHYRAVISAIVRAVRPIFAECQELQPLVHQPQVSPSVETPTLGKQRSHDSLPSQPLHSPEPQPQNNNQSPTLLEVPAKPSKPSSPLKANQTKADQTPGLESTEADSKVGLESTEADSKVDTTEAESTITQSTEQSIGQSTDSGSQSLSSTPSLLPDQETAFLIEQDQELEEKRDVELLKNK
ncbi:MAG: hypothetical protein F6K09_12200, partial [Merismopedia sp. SIO2A8]|nr:hypothetical protein [Merismopedia sp. SIO2A8]